MKIEFLHDFSKLQSIEVFQNNEQLLSIDLSSTTDVMDKLDALMAHGIRFVETELIFINFQDDFINGKIVTFEDNKLKIS